MNKEEIALAIRKKIKGQGSAIDAGGALADILDSLLELIPSSPTPDDSIIVELPSYTGSYGKLEPEERDKIMGCLGVKFGNNIYPRCDGVLNLLLSDNKLLGASIFSVMEDLGMTPAILGLFGSMISYNDLLPGGAVDTYSIIVVGSGLKYALIDF